MQHQASYLPQQYCHTTAKGYITASSIANCNLIQQYANTAAVGCYCNKYCKLKLTASIRQYSRSRLYYCNKYCNSNLLQLYANTAAVGYITATSIANCNLLQLYANAAAVGYITATSIATLTYCSFTPIQPQ
jgi:hypothetical protein